MSFDFFKVRAGRRQRVNLYSTEKTTQGGNTKLPIRSMKKINKGLP